MPYSTLPYHVGSLQGLMRTLLGDMETLPQEGNQIFRGESIPDTHSLFSLSVFNQTDFSHVLDIFEYRLLSFWSLKLTGQDMSPLALPLLLLPSCPASDSSDCSRLVD